MAGSSVNRFLPFTPRVLLGWPEETYWQRREGSMVMVDISGFTAMSERLAKKGKVGAEEVTHVLNRTFTELLTICDALGGDLLKFGGDALLVFFEGDEHEVRASRAAAQMRSTLRTVGNVATPAGKVKLKMSVGVHTGDYLLILAGESHRELVVVGPNTSEVVELQEQADADEILVSPETAAALPASCLGDEKGDGVLLIRTPPAPASVTVPMLRTTGDPERFVPVGLRPMLEFSDYESEHRNATIGFIHFEHSDDLIAEQGQEALCVAINALIRVVQEAVAAYDLTFLATDVDVNGGKVILSAGVPTSTPTDEDNMLRAVLQIAGTYDGLPIRIGVNRGPLFAGDVGAPFRRSYTVIGDAVNLSARVMAKAGMGQVLATQDVLDRSETWFRTEEMEPFLVKGKTQPVSAWQVKGVEGRRQRSHDDFAMVGRAEEFARIGDAVSDGSASLIEITGPAGIGKSRLVRAVREGHDQVAWHFTDCDQYESTTPYYPFRRLLREVLDLPAEPSEADLRSLVVASAPELEPWIPLLGIPLGIDIAETPEVRRLAPKFRTARLHDSVVQLIETVGEPPIALIIEDAQFIDEASHALLEFLANALEGRGVSIVVRRPSDVEFKADAALHVELEALDDEAAAQLVNAIRHDRPLLQHQVRGIVERGQGNPLFITELAQATDGDELPDSLESLLLARIDRLQPDLRRVLRYGAVAGVTFDRDLACDAFGDVVPAINDDATWAGLDEFLAIRSTGELRFKQALFRDVAYGGLPFATRKQLHERVAKALVKRKAEPSRIAVHSMQAGRFEEAWKYSIEAGNEAASQHANVEAVESFRRALAAAKRMHRRDGEVAEVGEKLGVAAERAGLIEEADTAYGEARRILEQLDLSVETVGRLMRRQGLLREKKGAYAQALRWFRRGLRRMEKSSNGVTERAELLLAYAGVRYRQAKYAETIEWSDRARDLIGGHQADAELAHCFSLLGLAHRRLGSDKSFQYLRDALEIYEQLEDLVGQADCLNNLGAADYYASQWERASRRWEQCTEVRLKAGDVVGAAMAQNNIGVIRSDQGRLDEARELLTQVYRDLRAAGFKLGHEAVKSNLGRVASRSGDYDLAMQLLHEAAAELDDIGARHFVFEAETRIAECELFAGNVDAAATKSRKLLTELNTDSGPSDVVATLHWIAGHAERLMGNLDAAVGQFEAGFNTGVAAHAPFETALNLLGMSDLGVGMDDEAGEDPRATIRHLGVVKLPPVPRTVPV